MPPHEQRPAFHQALGEAYRLLGDEAAAASHFRLAQDPVPGSARNRTNRSSPDQ
jgi:hypothetical protein